MSVSRSLVISLKAANALHFHDDEGSEKAHWVSGRSAGTIGVKATEQGCFGKA
jgi:hypothetical protein